MRRTLVVGTVALLAISGCAEPRTSGPPPAESTARPFPGLMATALASAALGPALVPSSAAPEVAPSATAAVTAPLLWIEAVRLERWTEAGALLEALPEAERLRPEMRYLRARAAIGAGDNARAIPLLAGLEVEAPLLADDVTRWRAEAQLVAGPYGEAAAYFARSPKARDLRRAAGAYDKAGDEASARKTADLAVAAAAKTKSTREEVEARLVRARLHEARGRAAAAEPDYRWIATRSPGSAGGRAAVEALEKMKHPLTPKERLQMVDGLVEAGSHDEIERLGKQPETASPELAHARAMALYKARDYEAAAKAFQSAAKAPGKRGHEAEELFYAARSLARANRDEDAIKAYLSLVSRFGKSPWAEKAQYLAARLYLQNGRFKDAARAYTTYLVSFRKGAQKGLAEYERSLAWLSSGEPAAARKSLAAQAQRAGGDDAMKLRELLGVAALRTGDRAEAIGIWSEIAKAQPLSWAALASRSRLASVSAPAPALIEPSPTAAAADLKIKLPPLPALLASLGLDGDAESRLAAIEREIASSYGNREGEALCGLYGQLSRAKRRYRIGINAVSASSLLRAPSEADRWTWECLYPQPFAGGVRSLEEQHGLPAGLLHALMRQESAFDPAVVSPASAVGLMQLMPATAKQAATEMAVDFDPEHLTTPDVNLRLGAFYITKLLKMFQGQVVLAAAAYNAGPRAAAHWVEAGADNDVDLWVARIPFDETRTYVARVAQNLARYQFLHGGKAGVLPLPLSIPPGIKASADAY